MSNSSCYLKQKKSLCQDPPTISSYFHSLLFLYPQPVPYQPFVFSSCVLLLSYTKYLGENISRSIPVLFEGVFLPVGRLLPILPSFEVHLLCSCDVTDLQYLSTMCLSISVPVNVCLFLTARGAGVSTGYQLKTKLTI